MARWDVQRDVRDGRIIAIRPEGYWAKHPEFTGDNIYPLQVASEDLGLSYYDLDAVSLEKGGDGLAKTAKQLRAEVAAQEDPESAAKALTIEQLTQAAADKGLVLTPKAVK